VTSTGGSSTLARKKTSATTTTSARESVQPASRKAWRAWLETHHASSSGVWLVYAKKHTGIPSLTYNDAVEEALCFGWIDSLVHPIDERLYRQVFTPRKPKSVWSALNRGRVARMIKARQMTPAGMAMVKLAKESATWEALKHVEDLLPPPDLKKALNANSAAKKNWSRCPPGLRKTLLFWLYNVKRPETRAPRIAAIVDRVAGRT
jgi:uncharacterized protein YdeI (YjbR/CyaY-like superfamily)